MKYMRNSGKRSSRVAKKTIFSSITLKEWLTDVSSSLTSRMAIIRARQAVLNQLGFLNWSLGRLAFRCSTRIVVKTCMVNKGSIRARSFKGLTKLSANLPLNTKILTSCKSTLLMQSMNTKTEQVLQNKRVRATMVAKRVVGPAWTASMN